MIKLKRHNTSEGVSPYDEITWVSAVAEITDVDGSVIFRQDPVIFPYFWSQTAINIVSQKYFRGALDDPDRENHLGFMVRRVVNTIASWGVAHEYFDMDNAEIFRDELAYLLLHQKMSFNSPVWFNVGVEDHPQASACFIQSVEDSMEGILQLARNEGMLFKYGSGTGTNLSSLRSSKELVGAGGTASGPVSFMRGFDSFAGAIKSGGKCLTGDQCVYTVNGPVPVKQLADSGDDFFVLSFDPPAGRYKVKRARAWKSGAKPCVKLETDKGSFSLSYDHPIRLSTRDYKVSGALSEGISLFSCKIDQQETGYLRVGLRDGKKGREFIHRLVAKDILNESVEGFVVHHRDGDKLNNSPENLVVSTQAEHASLHGREQVASGTHVFQNNVFPKTGGTNGMHSTSGFWQDFDKVSAYKQRQREILLNRGCAAEMQNSAAKVRMVNLAFEVLNAGYSIDSFEEYIKGREASIGRVASKKKVRKSINNRFGSFENFREEVFASNHRVVRVTNIGIHPVYSVEVDCPTEDDKSPLTGHNYVIWNGNDLTGSGIVVSNTRRAAKMVILNVDHPDIEDFIDCKAREEQKAWALIDAGYDGGFNVPGGAYDTVSYQNANHSVRVPDDFMYAYEEANDWELKSVTTGEILAKVPAQGLMRKMAEAAHLCGDPGIQFDDTINEWHTCANTDRIKASNPCSEYMFLDDSACNLASLNLMKFQDDYDDFDVDSFTHAVSTTILAMEIIVGNASYPTEAIKQNSIKFRPLGLGYANLGALLMSKGMPYDGDDGRDYAAAITSLMCATAYDTSVDIAREIGPCEGFRENRGPFLGVINKHYQHSLTTSTKLNSSRDLIFIAPSSIWTRAAERWDSAWNKGAEFGFRNCQATVLAPTGTIGFMMDCDTTGIEPDIALVKYKRLVGGGTIKIVNQGVRNALAYLGYNERQIDEIVEYVEREGTIEGSSILEQHLPVFDCAFKSEKGTRSIHYMGHIKMMAAVQPYLSGSISKTVNMPRDCSVNDIEQAYVQAWKLGLKSIAVYRDGSKRTQPLSTSMAGGAQVKNGRRRLPTTRDSTTHKFEIGGNEGYLTVGKYDDGTPGEIFIRMAKEGSVISGLLDGVATAVSIGLQSGVPLSSFAAKYIGTRFEPSGFTKNEDIRIATSVLDYVFRWLTAQFSDSQPVVQDTSSNPPCSECGTITVVNGSCYKCPNCGATTGCS